jgi:hypothetical protein
MKLLKQTLKKASSFEEVLKITLEEIAFVKNKNPQMKIGYVAGKVTADGEDNIGKNLERLDDFVEETRKNFNGLYSLLQMFLLKKHIGGRIFLSQFMKMNFIFFGKKLSVGE